MTCSVGGQDKSPDPTLGLAILAGKMALSCPFGITRSVPQKNKEQCSFPYNKSFIDQVCSVKMVGYWSRPFLHVLDPPCEQSLFYLFLLCLYACIFIPCLQGEKDLAP